MNLPVDFFRVYEEARADGYPAEWHSDVKHLVRTQAENRCERCRHPYQTGAHPMERVEDEDGAAYVSWSPCDRECRHGGPGRYLAWGEWIEVDFPRAYDEEGGLLHCLSEYPVEARARILTVHHLNGVKTDCRWWNLASLCQRCHLHIQKKVLMERVFPFEHSDWFKPHAAGWYAFAYLGEQLTREETLERMDELLGLERVA